MSGYNLPDDVNHIPLPGDPSKQTSLADEFNDSDDNRKLDLIEQYIDPYNITIYVISELCNSGRITTQDMIERFEDDTRRKYIEERL